MTSYAIVIALSLIGTAFAAQGTPAATSYCMGNVNDATTCSACFNWGKGGTIGARDLATNACANAVTNAITDCKVYSSTKTTTNSLQDCMQCNSKDWYNITDHATAATRTRACSDTAASTTTCSATVSNCDQSMCFTSAAAAVSVGCRMCKSGYMMSGTAISSNDGNVGYPSCVTMTIANADYGSPIDSTKVLYCKSDYAVATAGTSCISFTTDSNCGQLGSTDAYCGVCWHSYYFDTTTCKLESNLMKVAGLLVVALAALLM